jgi:quercetin 2,3-dioxygenase
MITPLRVSERFHMGCRGRAAWLTFDPSDDCEAIETLTECCLAPRGGLPRVSVRDVEILTYVYEGALAFESSLGASGVVQAGEFQHLTAGRGIHSSQTNQSRTDSARFFQIWLRSWELGLQPEHDQRRFTAAQRRGGLCGVASHDARAGSLRIHQDAQIYSALLDPGSYVVHELAPARREWLHIVQGEVALEDTILTTGDGAGVTGQRAVSFMAREESEILLINLGTPHVEGSKARS